MYKFERTYAGTYAVTGPGLLALGVVWDKVDDAERCAIALNQTHHYAEHKLAQIDQIRAALKREQHAVSTALRTPCHVSLVKHARDVRALADQVTAGPDGVDVLAPLRTREVVGTVADKAMPLRVVEMVVERVESLKREVVDGDEFALDFGFPAVASRPLTPTVETTAQDARVARQNRSAEFRAQWHAEREVRS